MTGRIRRLLLMQGFCQRDVDSLTGIGKLARWTPLSCAARRGKSPECQPGGTNKIRRSHGEKFRTLAIYLCSSAVQKSCRQPVTCRSC